jgi:transposase InsO family protein
LVDQIRGIFQDSGERYGAPRVHAELQIRGFRIARKRVARLMRENDIRPPRRRKRPPITTDSRHGYGIAPNLLQRAFEADQPNTIWLADITYVATDEGWLYLAAIKDMATHEIVGWSMADHLRSSLCENALMMAIKRRRPLTRTDAPLRRRIQAVVATRSVCFPLWMALRISSRASAGVFQPRVLRGLVLRASATAARVSASCTLRSVLLGKY